MSEPRPKSSKPISDARKRYLTAVKKSQKQENIWAQESSHAGFLVTCDQNQVDRCKRELMFFLNEYLDKYLESRSKTSNQSSPSPHFLERTDSEKQASENQHTDNIRNEQAEPSQTQSERSSTEKRTEEKGEMREKNISEEVDEELSSLKQVHKRSLIWIDTGTKGVIFVGLSKHYQERHSISTPDFIHFLFSELQKSKTLSSRYIQRIIPIQETCGSSLGEIQSKLKPLIDGVFQQTPHTFCILWKNRMNNKLERDHCIKEIASLISSPHSVKLSNPEYSIIVELWKTGGGVSIVPNTSVLFNFNLRKCVEQFTTPIDEKTISDVPIEIKSQQPSSDQDSASNLPKPQTGETKKRTREHGKRTRPKKQKQPKGDDIRLF